MPRPIRFLLPLLLVGLATASEPLADADLKLVCAGAVGGKDLTLHLGLRGGRLVGGFAAGWNAFPTVLEVGGLAITEGRLRGRLTASLLADPWLPVDGQPVPIDWGLDCALEPEVAGSWEGTTRGVEARGAIGGTVQPPADGVDARLALRLHQAFYRLAPAAGVKGPNQDYALDMSLSLLRRAGAGTMPRLETVVPDYRGYSAVVHDYRLEQDGPRLRLLLDATLDSGDQGAAELPRQERYQYVFEGWELNGLLAGSATVTVGELTGTIPAWGGSDSAPLPPLAGARGMVRLYEAMRGAGPVLLDLAVHADAPIHGLAWTPRYNHQPQPIDASGLRLEGSRLRGAVLVQVRPDCYHHQDVRFTVRYELDLAASDGALRGTYTGQDGELATSGLALGEWRRKEPPAVQGLGGLDGIAFGLGLALPQAPANQGQATVTVRFTADGAVASGSVAGPAGATWQGTFTTATVELAGDRLTAELAFAVSGAGAADGAYRFQCQAMVDGAQLSGLWLGEHDGRPVLTKSAKLGGQLLPVAP